MGNIHWQEVLWMFKCSLHQKLFVKKAKAEISALAKKKKETVPYWKVWGFVALVNLSVICLFMYSFLRAWIAKPALRSCAEITFAELNWMWMHILPDHRTCWQVWERTQWCSKVLLSSMVKVLAKFITWWADTVSLLIVCQQFWQEQMAMSFSDDYQCCKPTKAPEGQRPLGILPGQQLFCNSNGCPSSLQAEAIEAQLPCAWF